MRSGSGSVFAILIGFLLVVVLFIVMTTGVLVAGLTAYPAEAAGTVELQRSGKGDWRPLRTGPDERDLVKVGDKVRTGADGTLALQWADGTRLELDPNTTLMVKKYRFDLPEETKPESAKQVSLFDLDLGKVWVRVRHRLRGDSRFEIATATAVAGVRGTIFSVEADADGTAIEVFDGQVTVAAGDDTAAIGPRMAAQATAQDLAVRPLSLAEQEAWADRDVLLPGVRFRRFLPARVQADGTYRLRGDTEPGATVTVDDQPVTVEPDGSFETTVRVQPGVNTWRVRVEDAAGHRRDTEYIIDHRPTTS